MEDPRVLLRRGPMSGFQIAAVTICMIVNMLDGFDVLSIAFTGPAIAREWSLVPTQLGLLFSSGLVGMTVGSLVISPVADAIGRRRLTLIGLLVITAGMLSSGFAHGLRELALLRIVTGLGIGSLLSSINTIVVEFSSAKRKDFAVSFMSVGYPIGATIGGIVAVFLIHAFGWRSVFVFGGLCSAVLLPVAFVCLPESLDFLLLKRPRNALARANALLVRMGIPAIVELPAAQDRAENAAQSAFSIFDRAFAWRTALICSAYFLTMIPFYFVLNWTPKVLVDEGLSLTTGISGAILMNASGVVGGLLFGLAARPFGLQRLGAVYMLMLFASITAFGFAGSNLVLLMAFAMAIGFCLIGTISALFAVVGQLYPVRVRNTGTGLAIGLGRLGAIAGPYLGGVLIASGWTRPLYCVVLALPLIASAYLIRRVPLLGTESV
jgi:benzoate transport